MFNDMAFLCISATRSYFGMLRHRTQGANVPFQAAITYAR